MEPWRIRYKRVRHTNPPSPFERSSNSPPFNSILNGGRRELRTFQPRELRMKFPSGFHSLWCEWPRSELTYDFSHVLQYRLLSRITGEIVLLLDIVTQVE